MLFDQRNLPSFQALLKLMQDQASASTVHRAIHFQSHLQIGIRPLWQTICCDNVLTPSSGSSQSPAMLIVRICKSATVLCPVPSIALLCSVQDQGLVVANLQKNGICSDFGLHTLSYPSNCWTCLHLCDSPARRSHCKVNHEMLSWWHDGLANFVHASWPFYTLMKQDFLLSQRHVYCRPSQENLPATQHSTSQVLGSTNIERLLVSVSILRSQLAMREVVKPCEDEDDSALQICFKHNPQSSVSAVTSRHCHDAAGGMKTGKRSVCRAPSKMIKEDYWDLLVQSGTILCIQVVCHVLLAVANRTSLSAKCSKAFLKL